MPLDGTTYLPVIELLAEGRRKIEKGWCQHVARSRLGVCMMVSIESQDPARHDAAILALTSALRGTGYKRDIIEFNDAPGRTKEEVLAIFDAALGVIMP